MTDLFENSSPRLLLLPVDRDCLTTLRSGHPYMFSAEHLSFCIPINCCISVNHCMFAMFF